MAQRVQAPRRRRGPDRGRDRLVEGQARRHRQGQRDRRRDRDRQVARRAAVAVRRRRHRAARRRGRRRSTSARRSSPSTPVRRRAAARRPRRRRAPTRRRRPRRPPRSASRPPTAPSSPGMIGGPAPTADARRCSSATARGRRPPSAARARRRAARRGHRAAGVSPCRADRGAAAAAPGRPSAAGAAAPSGANGAGARCSPSRRSASWPRTSASTSPPCRRPARAATITRDDVERGRRAARSERRRAAAGAPPRPAAERETRIPVKGVRKMTPQAMVASAFTAPHVTVLVTVDVTRTMELVERLQGRPRVRRREGQPAAVVAKALILGGAAQPRRSTRPGTRRPRRSCVKHYVNLGIAAATPRGLHRARTSRTPTGCRCASWPRRSAS